MGEQLCRICSKTVKENYPIDLFANQNKEILLQIKDLTGVRLKNNSGLPQFMCCVCKKELLEAYKFREEFLKVQEYFRLRYSKGSKRQIQKEFIEATEFVQVRDVKEEIDISTEYENIYTGDEEKEINIVDTEDFNKKKNNSQENKDEINALELKSNEPKVALENLINNKKDTAYDTSEAFSEDEHFYNIEVEEKFMAETEITKTNKSKWNRKCKKTDHPPIEKGSTIAKRKINKTGKKRKGDKNLKNIFICDQCGNSFNCRHHFKLHLRRHTGDKRCACELCPDKFFTSSELRRHMRRHTGERPFACRYCDRRFTDYSTRLKHERTHTNERPFMCAQCGKSFTTSYILKNHMLTHTGERHFKCDVCNRAFTRRTHLLVHFRSMMHKQAVEKEKHPVSQEDLSEPHCLIQRPTPSPTFIV